jgi:hypothetical protein
LATSNNETTRSSANEIENDALQRYSDMLGTISWPAGTFEGQANTLRKHLLGLIDFDRHQVDVATTAQIVQSPEGGTPDWVAARQVQLAVDTTRRRPEQRQAGSRGIPRRFAGPAGVDGERLDHPQQIIDAGAD